MPIITLTSDWQKGDFYISSVKGAILKQLPTATIVDVSHDIAAHHSMHAAFVLKHSYPHFPEGSVHIIAVNTERSDKEALVVCEINKQFFIGIDNGQFSLISNEKPENIITLQPDSFNLQLQSFPVLNLYVNAACRLANGEKISNLGTPKADIIRQPDFMEAIDDNSINARIIYIDSYGNAMTNLTRETFERVGKNRNFAIYVKSRQNKISHISNFYNEIDKGQLLAIFNSINLLEIAINSGNASELLGLRANDSGVIIRFTPSV